MGESEKKPIFWTEARLRDFEQIRREKPQHVSPRRDPASLVILDAPPAGVAPTPAKEPIKASTAEGWLYAGALTLIGYGLVRWIGKGL